VVLRVGAIVLCDEVYTDGPVDRTTHGTRMAKVRPYGFLISGLVLHVAKLRMLFSHVVACVHVKY